MPKPLLESTLGEARAKGFRVIEDRCLTALGVIAESLDDPVATLELFQQTLDLARSAGDRWTERNSSGQSGMGLAWRGRSGEGGARPRDGLADLQSGRRPDNGVCVALRVVAPRPMASADARALELAHTALGGAVAAKAREWETTALLRLGDAELALGRQDAAELAFVQAHAYAIEGGGGQQFVAAAGIARVALTRGDAGGGVARDRRTNGTLGQPKRGSERLGCALDQAHLLPRSRTSARPTLCGRWLEQTYPNCSPLRRASPTTDCAIASSRTSHKTARSWLRGSRPTDTAPAETEGRPLRDDARAVWPHPTVAGANRQKTPHR